MELLKLYGCLFFFFQAEDGIRDGTVTGVQTCALPISPPPPAGPPPPPSMPKRPRRNPKMRERPSYPSRRSSAELFVLPPMYGRSAAGIESTITTHQPLATSVVTPAIARPAMRRRSEPCAA